MASPYEDRPVRWDEFVQRIRAHPPAELLQALATIAATDFTGGFVKPRTSGWTPWAIAAASREAIAYGSEHRTAPITDAALARILNAHNDLEDPITTGGQHGGAWDMILRTVFQQFHLSSAVFGDLARFAAIFDRPFPPNEYTVLNQEAITGLLGASVTDYLGATFLFMVGAQRNQGQFDLDWLSQPQFQPVVAEMPAQTLTDIFRRTFSAPFADVRAAARARRNPNRALRVHDFNPLVATPYVGFTPTKFLAPHPRLVADKASLSAVYHLGVGRFGAPFSRELGYLIETYSGEQLRLVPQSTLTPEREYKPGQRSVDWILALPDVVVLIEVKSARVNQPARLNLAEYHQDVAADVGKAFSQISRTASLIRQSHAAFADVPIDRPLRGLVVTAEPHYLINSPIYREGLPDSTIPTTVVHLGELESLVEFSRVRDPSQVVLTLTDHPVNVTTIHNNWYAQHTTKPRNPILDAAWNRMPWKGATDARLTREERAAGSRGPR